MIDSQEAAYHLWKNILCDGVRNRISEGINGDISPVALFSFLSSAHDIGKASPAFQNMIHGSTRVGSVKHAELSQYILERRGLDISVALVVGNHHGSVNTRSDIRRVQAYSYETGEDNPDWISIQNRFFDFCCEISGTTPESLSGVTLDVAAQALLSALVALADRIASGLTDSEIPVLGQWHPHPKPFDEVFGFKPYPFQSTLLDIAEGVSEPGLMVVEAPMGEGKTEAALAAAEVLAQRFKLNGLMFALPTQATAHSMYGRIEDWMNRSGYDCSLSLVHDRADLYRFSGRFVDTGDISVPRLLSGVVVGTVDQVLLAGLKQKFLFIRHLALAGKVVVIDECHAYDAFMTRYLETVLCWLGFYKVPVILLSATLPSSKRKQLISAYLQGRGSDLPETSVEGYPRITYTDGCRVEEVISEGSGRSMDVTVKRISKSDLDSVLEDLPKESVTGVFVNTIRRAQAVFSSIREKFPDRDAILIHSGFTVSDRLEKEKRIMAAAGADRSPGKGIIVVGTQVIEQSMDLDFDVMFTDLCPTDLLLQRIGRLHRHRNIRPESLESPICYLMDTGEGEFDRGTVLVYGRYHLMNTRRLVCDTLSFPDDIPKLVEAAYAEVCQVHGDPVYEREWNTECLKNKSKRRNALFSMIRLPQNSQHLVDWYSDEPYQRHDSPVLRGMVRDSEACIEVIPVVLNRKRLHLLPWIMDGRELPKGKIPEDMVDVLFGCTLQLPYTAFKSPDYVIKTLYKENYKVLPNLWLCGISPLAGEAFLVLDESLKGKVMGVNLSYDADRGLCVLD